MPLTQSSVLNQGGYNTLFGNTPSGNVTTQNSPGVIPQVYPGSTGSGTQQNSTTPQYGGFTPQAFSPYTPNWSSNQQNNGGLGGTASAFDAWRMAMGGAPMGNYSQSQSQTQNPLGVQTANAQTNNGLYGSYGSSGAQNLTGTGAPALPSYAGNEITGTPTGSFITIGGKNYAYSPGSQPLNGVNDQASVTHAQNNQDPNQGLSQFQAPTNTGSNPNPGIPSSSPFSGMQGLYAQMLADYHNRVKEYDDSNLDVNKTTQDLADFQKNYANAVAGVQGNNDWSIDTQQGKAQVLGNQAANTLPYLQTKLNNATALRSQNLNAMSDLANATRNVPYDVYMNPVNGEVINQGGAGNALFQKGMNQGTQQAGYNAAGSNVAVNQSDALANQFNTQLSAAPDFQSNPLGVVNALFNAYKGNVSDPKYASLATPFTTIVNGLKGILGQETIDQAMNFVHSNPQALQSTINSLISQAKTKVQYSNPQGTSAPSGGTNNGSSGGTSFGDQW